MSFLSAIKSSVSEGADKFFSNVKESASTTLTSALKDTLPIWYTSAKESQQGQLQTPTFNAANMPATLANTPTTVSNTGTTEKVLFDKTDQSKSLIRFDGPSLLIIAAAGIAVFAAITFVKRI